jgi:hypothetical protein
VPDKASLTCHAVLCLAQYFSRRFPSLREKNKGWRLDYVLVRGASARHPPAWSLRQLALLFRL